MIFPPPNFTVFWVNLGSMRALVGLLQYVGGEQMATRECGTGKAEIMKNLKTKGVS